MKSRFLITILVTLVALAALGTTAGARTARDAPAQKVTHKTHLTNVPAIKRYLRAHGISTAGLVVQQGKRNYAGRNCPGSGWTCSKATRVIQLARSADGENSFECSASNAPAPAGFPPAPFATSTAPPTACVIVQVRTSGRNTARCVIHSSQTPTVTESCAIHQENANGLNEAFVDEVVHQAAGTSQTATARARVEQQNRFGGNSLAATQTIDQSSTESGTMISQDQTPTIDLQVNQTSDSGRQVARGAQTVTSALVAHGFDGHDDPASASLMSGTQNQNSNLTGSVFQNSVNVSAAAVSQSELLSQSAPTGSGVQQTQFGPLECCTFQQSNPSNRFDIVQSSRLYATSPFADQSTFLEGTCDSSGTCNVSQRARTNSGMATNTCTGPSCDITIDCFGGGSEAPTAQTSSGTCFAGTGGGSTRMVGAMRSSLKNERR